jgi:hypothetical protein
MLVMVSLASRLMTCAALAATAAACMSTPPASPPLMARCTQLYALWVRYEPVLTLMHTGQKVRVELAMQDCQHGRYEAGIRELEKILRRGRIPLPRTDPTDVAGTPSSTAGFRSLHHQRRSNRQRSQTLPRIAACRSPAKCCLAAYLSNFPVIVALASVLKWSWKPTMAAEVSAATGSDASFTAKTVKT